MSENTGSDEDFVTLVKAYLLLAGFSAMWYSIGYYFGYCDKKEKKQQKPKNTFFLFDNDSDLSLWDTVFSSKVDGYKGLYNAIIKVPDNETINIVIKTHGGSFYWCNMIGRVLKEREGKVRVFINSYAHSAGTIIALSADEVYMTKYATLSAIDPQVDVLQFFSYLPLKNLGDMIKSKENVSEHITSNSQYYCDEIRNLINANYDVDKIIEQMYMKIVDHSKLFSRTEVKSLGINVIDWDGKDIVEEEVKEEKFDNLTA